MHNKCFSGRVVFDHLPKTAGMAINAWLRSELGAGSVKGDIAGNHKELITQFGGEYSIISAHVAFDGHGWDHRYHYATCFRDPIDRVISFIFFVLENHGDQDLVGLRSGVRSFLETEGNQGGEYIFSNAMTEHLCSIHGVYPEYPTERLECALSVVDEYALWGLYEHLPEFINDFSAFLEVPAPLTLDPVNTTRRRPKLAEISPHLRARIEELNALDIVLYERLQARYDDARLRWQRPAVAASKWQPLSEKPHRRFCHPDFALLSISHEGGGNVTQNAVLTFALKFSLAQATDALRFLLHIRDSQGRLAFGTNSTLNGTTIDPLAAGTHVVRHTVVAALPYGKYDVGFAFIEKSLGADRELAWLDKMVVFEVEIDRPPACEGYVSLPVAIGHQQLDQVVARLPDDGRGLLSFEKPVAQVAVCEEWMQAVTLHNYTTNAWQSFHLYPLHLSHHWLSTDGDVVEFDGLRTAFLFGRLGAGERRLMEMAIKAPEQPGRYRLQALPVMENHAWFDALGFTPGELEIEVLSPTMPRRFTAEDCRLKSNVGQCTLAARISEGREGFLCYGPYVPLTAGHWTICWHGQFDPRGSTIKLDVVAKAGTKLLAEHSLAQACSEVTLLVETHDAVKDVECRIWVSAEAEAKLDEIVIAPIGKHTNLQSASADTSHPISIATL